MKINHQILRLLWLLCIIFAGILSPPVAYAEQRRNWMGCTMGAFPFIAGTWHYKPDGTTKVTIPQTDPITSNLSPLPADSPPKVFMKTTWGWLLNACTPNQREAFAMMPHAENVRNMWGHMLLKIEATDKENKVRYTYGRSPPHKSPFYAVVTIEIYPAVDGIYPAAASNNCKPKYQRDDSIPSLIGYDFRNCGGMGVNMTLEFIQTTETCSVNITPPGYMHFPWAASGFQGELKYPAKPSAEQYHGGKDNSLLGKNIEKPNRLFTAQAICVSQSPPLPPAPVKKFDVVVKCAIQRR